MPVLTSTGKLQVVLGGAVTTNQLQCVASWRDITTGPTYVPGTSTVNTNDTTVVDWVTSPAASTQRVLVNLSVYNKDTVSATVTIMVDISGTDYILVVKEIAAGSSLEYSQDSGWAVFPAPVAGGGGDALTTNPLSQFAATTSLQLKGVISDETGSGALVFADTPTLVTPILGTPTSGTLTNCTGYTWANIASKPTTLAGFGITDAQGLDATLTAFAALTIAANSVTVGTGVDAFSQVTLAANQFLARASAGSLEAKTITDFGLSLLDDADAATVRTTLGIDTDDAVTFGDLTVNNLTVNGTVLTVNTATATVDDPLIRLGDNNAADSVDLGWYGVYVSGGTKYTGLFRDASDGKYRLYHGSDTEPTTTVNIGASGHAVSTLVANLESSSVAITGGSITGITDLAVADGGTGASDAATAATNLGLGAGDSPQFTAINLGHASDTTITRTGAGAIAVEGVAVLLSGGALGTPSSGTLTNCGGLPLSGVVDSTSEALGVGSLEIGHASDTTLARVRAGVASLEGKVVDRQSKSISIPDPTNAEDITLFRADEGWTITKMVAVLIGSSTPSVTWTIRKGSDRSAAGTEVVTGGTTTTSTTTGSVVTSFNSATIATDDFVFLETTAKSGVVDELHVTIFMEPT